MMVNTLRCRNGKVQRRLTELNPATGHEKTLYIID